MAGVVDSWSISIPLLEDGSMTALTLALVAGLAVASLDSHVSELT